MGFNTVRSTRDSLTFDAFYVDEFGRVNTRDNIRDPSNSARVGIHKNRFAFTLERDAAPLDELVRNNTELGLENQANPALNIAIRDPYKQTQILRTVQDRYPVQMYFSDSTVIAVVKGEQIVINVTVLYAVGTELNRHGIRSFFEKTTAHTAIILVPGTEPTKQDPGRWGVGISDAQIKLLIRTQFSKDVPYIVKILAGFSTGACGLHQTILHDLINFEKVERVIYFDCLYTLQCTATPATDAIKRLRSKAPSAKIIVYKTSEGGNSYTDASYARLAVVEANPLLFDRRAIIANLFQNADYIMLIYTRALEAAARDRIVTIPSKWEAEFRRVEAAVSLVPRGSFISNKAAHAFVHGASTTSAPTGKVFFEDWASANHSALAALNKHRGERKDQDSMSQVLWENTVPGWHPKPGSEGEEKHDLLIPEFGWEFLV